MSDKASTEPVFKCRVWILCTFCGAEIREVGERERVPSDRAYFCAKCDPGVIVPSQVEHVGPLRQA